MLAWESYQVRDFAYYRTAKDCFLKTLSVFWEIISTTRITSNSPLYWPLVEITDQSCLLLYWWRKTSFHPSASKLFLSFWRYFVHFPSLIF